MTNTQDNRQKNQDDRQESQDNRQSSQDNRQQTLDTRLAVMGADIRYMREDVTEIKAKISTGYVTKEEFEPVRRLVYGVVSLILISVVGALLALVVRSN